LARHYPRPKFYLSFDAAGFSVGTDGVLTVPVARQDIAAQVYRFLSLSSDATGEPFHPNPNRVRAVMWALQHECRRVHIPLPSCNGGLETQRYA
jgi:hypothetical protein